MATKVYGCSDDLVEFEGDVYGEVGCYGTNEDGSMLLSFSDGTFLSVYYEKNGKGIWGVELIEKGTLFSHIVLCVDEDDDPHSDVAHFADGLKWAYAAKNWERVK